MRNITTSSIRLIAVWYSSFITATVSLALAVTLADELPDLTAWKPILSFRPDRSLQKAVRDRGSNWAIHRIEDAAGDLNLDYYAVEVKELPTVEGKDLSPEELLGWVRRRFNYFIDTSIADFSAHRETDKKLWQAHDPTGAVLLIRLKKARVNPDDGCVVIAKSHATEWIFSTVRAGSGLTAALSRDNASAHPVSGNRAFGFVRRSDGSFSFYTIAADRPTRPLDARLGESVIFPSADARSGEVTSRGLSPSLTATAAGPRSARLSRSATRGNKSGTRSFTTCPWPRAGSDAPC